MNFQKKYKEFLRGWKKGKYKGTLRTVGLCVVTACGALLGSYYLQNRSAESSVDNLRKERYTAMGKPAAAVSDQPSGEMLSQYAGLYAQNPDLIGWLTIDGTRVDYPVMLTPADPQYYSRRGFDKTKSMNGLLFMDGSSNPYDYGGNTIIYGHNMKNGSMFADLLKYRDENFWTEHTVLKLDTLYESRIYEVAAVLESGDMDELPYGFISPEDEGAEDIIRNMRVNSLYDTGVDMKYGDDFLTLSTCEYNDAGGRFVVMARRIQ